MTWSKGVSTDKRQEREVQGKASATTGQDIQPNRRNILLGSTALTAASALGVAGRMPAAAQQASVRAPSGQRPNILVIFGDDIGQTNVSAYSHGVMGYRTPNIDRLAKDGMMFTDYYAEQ